ncbi:MAG: hypothetical protein NC401_15545 [Ruminococcus sp.]|nr:hypothetical protein [Ruminococcus sp.]
MTYINDIIKSGNIGKLKTAKGKTIDQLLLEQADYLKVLILKHMRDYRKAFKPKRYRRGVNSRLEDSVDVSSKVKCVNGVYVAYVYFNEKANHRSGYGAWAVKDGHGKYDDDIQNADSDKNVNVAALINDGYVVNTPTWFMYLPNFGFRGGNGFIDRAVMEFNATNPLGIVITLKDIIRGKGAREW